MSAGPDFMTSLSHRLVEERHIAESTATAYVRVLYTLNDKQMFKNLAFLKKTDVIDAKIAEYAPTTQRTLIASIVSVLTLYKTTPGFKKTYDHFYSRMMAGSKTARETPSPGTGTDKTETQTKNWVSWPDVLAKETALRDTVAKFAKKKVLTPVENVRLLQYMVLSLFTQIQPRRNQDYLQMYVVKRWSESLPTDRNYLDLSAKKFIFNIYKTAKKHGAQILDVPKPLMDILTLWLKHHTLWNAAGKDAGKTPIKLLALADGTPLTVGNSLTRILNKIFDGRHVGSSMLRHSFITDKYGSVVSEQARDAAAMGHTVGMQRDYVLKDGEKKDDDDDDASSTNSE